MGLTIYHLSIYCIIQHTEDQSMMRAELAGVIVNQFRVKIILTQSSIFKRKPKQLTTRNKSFNEEHKLQEASLGEQAEHGAPFL